MSYTGLKVRITGKVQGVGFRPYIWQLAQNLGLHGNVKNDSAGVEISLVEPVNYKELIQNIQSHLPPLAKIEDIHKSSFNWDKIPSDFQIISTELGNDTTGITPDAATCDQCLSEMRDPSNERYNYPFINCTHCGPRYTIIKSMPYDRAATSMASFNLCDTCKQEYNSPADRRFHAQPVACDKCGPYIFTTKEDGRVISKKEDALNEAVEYLKAGKIVAIKGLGGFHLACDATNSVAIARLRTRKRRPSKPFAVMAPDMKAINEITSVKNPQDLERLLTSSASPIVLAHFSKNTTLSNLIAPNLLEVGVMLPSNPIQHLLLDKIKIPLVMTSGNLNGRVPALSNEQALKDLNGIADLWLMHNRDILHRADDSVVRLLDNDYEVIRRARGFVPDSFKLPDGFSSKKPVLALGADLKNSFCLLQGNQAILGPHSGDLSEEGVLEEWKDALPHFTELYHCFPKHIVIDKHPGYLSHQWGQKQLAQITEVLHHHAHIASCMGEHGWALNAGPVIGLSLDGLGYGENGAIWGGECLLVDYTSCKHIGGLPPVALPGGDLAAKQPWRNQLAHFNQFVPDWQATPEGKPLLTKSWEILTKAIANGLNSPLSSSCGRLFDAASASLRVAPDEISWEGEAAITLAALAQTVQALKHQIVIPIIDNQIDMKVFWKEWLAFKGSQAEKAWLFHDILAQSFASLAKVAAKQHNISTVALSGGVMHNHLLRNRLQKHLAPLNVITQSKIPSGDGGIAFGQALIASALDTKKPA